jgi:hypothetical protein
MWSRMVFSAPPRYLPAICSSSFCPCPWGDMAVTSRLQFSAKTCHGTVRRGKEEQYHGGGGDLSAGAEYKVEAT